MRGICVRGEWTTAEEKTKAKVKKKKRVYERLETTRGNEVSAGGKQSAWRVQRESQAKWEDRDGERGRD